MTAATEVTAETVAENYELAVTAFREAKPNEAYIHVKNALQENPKHLPSKILLSKVFFENGEMEAAEEELFEALDLGADINLVLPTLGSALIIQQKPDRLLDLEKYRSKLNDENLFDWSLLKGQAYLLKDDETRAQFQFEQAQKSFPNNIRGLNSLATLYLQQGWFDKVENLVNRSLDLNSKNEKTWVLRGDLALARNRLPEALESYQQAYSLADEDPRILRSLAHMNLQLGNMEEVQRLVDKILKQTPGDPTGILINAWLMVTQNSSDEADQALADLSSRLSALEKDELESDHSLLFVQGAADYIQGNLEKAGQSLELYIKRRPGDTGAIRILSDIYLKQDRLDKAIGLLETNRDAVARDTGLSVQLVKLYINDDKLLNAEQLLKNINKLLPGHPYNLYLEALVAKARNRPHEALEKLNRIAPGSKPPLPFMLLLGDLYLQINDLQSAEKIADSLLAEKISHDDAKNFIAATYIRAGRYTLAMQQIDEILLKNPNNESAKFNKAIAFKAQGRLSEAKQLLNDILSKNENHTPSLLLMARIHLQEQNQEEAIAWANRVLVLQSNHMGALELKLTANLQQQNWQEALNTTNQLIKFDRLNEYYLVEKIQLLTRLQRYPDTVVYLNILSSLWSEDAKKLGKLAELYLNAELTKDAVEILENAISIDEKIADNHYQLARLHHISGNLAQASSTINSIAKTFGETYQLALLKGDLAMSSGQFAEARKHYLKSLHLEPGNQPAIISLYQLSLRGVEAKEFAKLMEKQLDTNANSAWMRRILADSYLNQEEWDKAQLHYEELLKLPQLNTDVGILNNLANIYARYDLQKALETARLGEKENTKSPALLDTIGWILAQQKKYEEALPYLREAFSMDAGSGEIRYHLGYTLFHLNRKVEAKSELKAALELANFSSLEDAQKLYDSM